LTPTLGLLVRLMQPYFAQFASAARRGVCPATCSGPDRKARAAPPHRPGRTLPPASAERHRCRRSPAAWARFSL